MQALITVYTSILVTVWLHVSCASCTPHTYSELNLHQGTRHAFKDQTIQLNKKWPCLCQPLRPHISHATQLRLEASRTRATRRAAMGLAPTSQDAKAVVSSERRFCAHARDRLRDSLLLAGHITQD